TFRSLERALPASAAGRWVCVTLADAATSADRRQTLPARYEGAAVAVGIVPSAPWIIDFGTRAARHRADRRSKRQGEDRQSGHALSPGFKHSPHSDFNTTLGRAVP